jgi:hypothetical protein
MRVNLLEDLEGIKIFLIFIKNGQRNVFQWWFPILTRTNFFSALQIRKLLNKTRGVFIGMFSSSDLNQTKTTGLFGCFGLELKQKFVRLHGVLMIYPSFKRIIHLCPDGDIRGNTAVFPFFYAIRLFISY